MRHIFLLLLLFICPKIWAQLNPVITGETILCPGGTEVLSTQTFDTYQWYVRYWGETVPTAIPGATSQTLLIDYDTYTLSYISVEVTSGVVTATSDEVLIDGWVFLPPTVMSTGNFTVGPEGESLICPGDTMYLTMNMPYVLNITWYNNGIPIPDETGTVLVVTEPGFYTASGAPELCPEYIQYLGVVIPVFYCAGAPLNPTISGDNMLCPESTGLVSTQTYDSYQWFIRYFGSTETNPIPGATSQTLVIDYNDFAASYVSVQVWLDGETAVSDEFFIDGWAFSPPVVITEGDYSVDLAGQFVLCEGDTMWMTLHIPYTENITWYMDGDTIAGATSSQLEVTMPGVYYVTGSPVECPNLVDGPGLPLVVIWCESGDVPEPVITGDDMLCPEGYGEVSVPDIYDAYQWYLRHYGSEETNPIPGATSHVLVMDYYDYALTYVSVEVWLDGYSAVSEEFLVDGHAFSPAVVISEGEYSVNMDGEFVLCEGDTMFFTLHIPYTENITWYLNDEIIVGETTSMLVVTEPGEYYVTGSPEECPEFVTGPGLPLIVVACDNVPVTDPVQEPEPVVLYPNPASLSITIYSDLDDADSYRIYDITGRLLCEGLLQGHATTVDLEKFASGVYLIRLNDVTGKVYRFIRM